MKIGVMLSGSGSTYRTIADAILDGRINGEIVRVISSKANAGGVKHAEELGHPVTVVDIKSADHHEQIAQTFIKDEVDLIVMAGYMHLWKLPTELECKTINVHPALIPAFCGKGMYGHHVHKAVVESGVKFSGCTVHLVDSEYDHGRILDQRVVPVECCDTADTLTARVQLAEKALLLQVISKWNLYREV